MGRTTYARLFSVLGTSYGSTSGSTFKIPDLRGRVAVGGTSLGTQDGEELHEMSYFALPSHTHTITAVNTAAMGIKNRPFTDWLWHVLSTWLPPTCVHGQHRRQQPAQQHDAVYCAEVHHQNVGGAMTIKPPRPEQIEQFDHNELLNIGANSHAQLDTHLAAAAPHSPDALCCLTPHDWCLCPQQKKFFLNFFSASSPALLPALGAGGGLRPFRPISQLPIFFLETRTFITFFYVKCTNQGSDAGLSVYVNLPFVSPTAQQMYGRKIAHIWLRRNWHHRCGVTSLCFSSLLQQRRNRCDERRLDDVWPAFEIRS